MKLRAILPLLLGASLFGDGTALAQPAAPEGEGRGALEPVAPESAPSSSEATTPAPQPQTAPLSAPAQDVEAGAPPSEAATPAQSEAELEAERAMEGLSAMELESLGLNLKAPVDTSFHFSGFSDFSAYVPVNPRGAASASLPAHPTMYVGNINLYLSKNLSESFRTMAEVRLTYLPNGTATSGSMGFTRYSTDTADYAENERLQRWGGIIMQRVYLEWTLHRLAILRAGQYLTPYGIWNVDHGSPTIIPVMRPYAIANNFFPERQTGFELFGRLDLGNYNTLGYHLTFSNGTGPVSEYRDLDKNKAFGGRAYLESRRVGMLRIGASGYYGRETNSVPTLTPVGNTLELGADINSQYDRLALAADVMWKIRGLHLQAEWVTLQRRYTEAGRAQHQVHFSSVSSGYPSDALLWGGYLLLAYQFDWYGITPFVMAEYNRDVIASTGQAFEVYNVHGGVNFHPIDAVTLKAEYLRGEFLNASPVFRYPVQSVLFQVAWAF